MKTKLFQFSGVWFLLFLLGGGLSVGNGLYARETPETAEDSLARVMEALGDDQCITCHVDLETLPEDFHVADVHLQPGLSCAGCHGGDPTVDDEELAKAPETGFIGVPKKQDIPGVCGRCHSDPEFMREYQPRIHTDQVDRYYTSVHGKRLREGDPKVATCTDCHTAHSILPASDSRSTVYALNVPFTCKKCHSDPEYMKEYGIRTDQFDKFAESVHGKALLEKQDTGAPACNDCHGNHGAVPPEVTSIRHVCGTCHVYNMQYFSATKMARAFQEEDLHACEECHGNHDIPKPTDNMVGVSDEAVCIDCHDEGEKGYQVAEKIHELLQELVAEYDSAEALKQEIERIGMDDIEIGYLLQDAKQALIHSRTLVHTFDPEKVAEKSQEGVKLARQAIELAKQEKHDYAVRRRGFAMATFFITLLAVALFFKIRMMESENARKNSTSKS